MRIELAKHSGFCTGVKNAVNKIVDEIGKCNEDILIHGQLIHSPQTVKILEKRGLKIINANDSVDGRITAIRTHGTTRNEFRSIKKRAKRVINLTCSNVAYVHGIVKKYSAKGYFVLILGDKDHAEVTGISSYSDSGFYIISEMKDIQSIPQAEKYILVSQTTLDLDFFDEAVKEIKRCVQHLEVINTICSATGERQDDLHHAVKNGADAIVVVGGKNSANTKRLAQIGLDNRIKTFHVESEEELNTEDFNDVKHVIVSAGASTPSWIVNNVLEKLYEIDFRSKRSRILYFFKSLLEFFIRTNLFSAFLTMFMTAAILPCTIFKCGSSLPLLSASFIFIMYSINNFFRPYEAQLSKPFKYNLYVKYKYLLIILTIIALGCFLFVSQRTAYPASVFYLIAFFCGFVYAIPSVTKLVSGMQNKFLKTIFGVKAIISSGGWAFIALIIPFIINPYDYLEFASILLIISSIIFVRNILVDMTDYQGDMLLGIETVITIFGFRITKIMVVSLSFLYTISVFYQFAFINKTAVLYMLNMFYYYFLYKKIKRNYYFYKFKYELLIDLNFLFFAAFAVIYDYIKI